MNNKTTSRPRTAGNNFINRSLYALRQMVRPVRPSARAGMGAIPYEGGTTFRVWAPHAQRVYVTGTFNNWSGQQAPLASEGNGYWSADVRGAEVGDEYKYVVHNGRRRFPRTDPYTRDVVPGHDNAVIVGLDHPGHEPAGTEAGQFHRPSLNELVIYELHVGTFAESAGGPPGSFQGVIDRLPYLQQLGVNAIELMPVAAFPGDHSWGYNPSHPFAVSRAYGGREGLQQLVNAAHEHGIAVIMDVVYNHFGPTDLSLWQFDGWSQNEMGGIYFYNDWRSQTPWAHTRPDYGRAEVRQYLRDNALMWLEEFQLDGLRWDATAFIRNVHGRDGDPGSDIAEGWSLLQWINSEIGSRFPGSIAIAEDLQNNPWVTKHPGEAGAGFNAQWDANFVHPVRQAIIALRDEDRDMAAVRDAITFRYNGDVFDRVIYTESHDEVANGKARVMHEIAPEEGGNLFARKRSALGAALVFTTPGVPMIFQGQEFLEEGWFDDQTPLDWAKAEANRGMVNFYRDLIYLRRNCHGNTRGLTGQHVNVYHVNNEDKLIAFHRWSEGGPGDDVIVALNFSHHAYDAYPIGLPHAGAWQVRFNGDLKAYDPEFGDTASPALEAVAADRDGLPYEGNLVIGPYSAVILSQSLDN